MVSAKRGNPPLIQLNTKTDVRGVGGGGEGNNITNFTHNWRKERFKVEETL